MIGVNMTGESALAWPAQATHARLWDAGVTWRDIHVAPGTFDWTRLDAVVDAVAGRHVTYVIGATPRWLAKHPDQPHAAPWLGPGSNSMPYNVAAFVAFCRALATRYLGRIHAYEMWNEPQLADFLYPYTDAECNTLATMTLRGRAAIKARAPHARVLAASVLPRASSGGMTRAGRYLRALARKGWPVDGFTTHIYPEPGTGCKRWASMLQDVASSLRAAGAPTSDLWVTETGYGLLGPEIPDAKATELVGGTYTAAGRRPIYWYAPDRPDLGGMPITLDPPSAAWQAIIDKGGTP